jgi:hypothetical protein
VLEGLGFSNTRVVSVGSGSPESVGGVGGDPQSVGELESVGSQHLPRREWRINKQGELRGVYFVWPGKEKKPFRYVGKRTSPDEFKTYLGIFQEWKRANRSLESVGILIH